MHKGKLSISRIRSDDKTVDGNILITIESEEWGYEGTIIIKPEQLANALTGLAAQEIKYEFH